MTTMSVVYQVVEVVKQQEVKDRRELIQAGDFQVSRIRSAIKVFYGRDSERVIELGARPVRPRTGKVQQAKAKPPTASQPGTSGAPPPSAAAPNEKDEAPRNPTAG